MSLSLNCVRRVALLGVAATLLAGGALSAQMVKAPRYGAASSVADAPARKLDLPPLPPAITPGGQVVEDVVVRVNDQIISRSDVQRAEEELEQQEAQNPAAVPESAQKNLLRDMIDKQLLISRAKELGLNADADVIRQLDDIRKQNHMDSLDDLEKAAKQQGISFEDFKAQIRNQILTQQVVREEVGRRLQMNQAEETAYYQEHLADFQQPEQVRLSEILVPLAENATPEEIAKAEAKANELKTRVAKGEDFAEVAKKYSGGPSAAQGGELGLFKRGALAKVLEDQTFGLKPGESTQPIRTRQGFVILKVTAHNDAGPAPMEQVEQQIQEAMYMKAMQPALRAYLTKLREEAYIDVQPGFVDSGASTKETRPVFTAYAPPAPKKKVVKQASRFERRPTSAKAVVASPDTTGGRTLTGAEARTAAIDPNTGLGVIAAPATPAAAASTTAAASGKSRKNAGSKAPKLAKREKVRFGQAPRNALPGDGDTTPIRTVDGGAVASSATALAMATTPTTPNNVAASTTVANNGAAGSEAGGVDENALTPVAPVRSKTRFSAKAAEVKEKKVTAASVRKAEKLDKKPVERTAEESATAKVQAAPLGLNGDTSKKPKKAKKVKGAKKERLEAKKPVAPVAPAAIDQTASPTLAPTSIAPSSDKPNQSPDVPNSSVPRPASNVPNSTTLPPVTQPVPGQMQQGTPVPPLSL